MNYFYERNSKMMESPVNKTFEELLWMSKDEFRQWVIDLRTTVVRLWDVDGQPPRVGYDEPEIIAQFRKMERFGVKTFEHTDEHTGEHNVVRCTTNLGNAINQFFPTMMKTRINYTKDPSAGRSIYDYFARPDLLDKFVTYASRHFKRDSFYNYSRPLKAGDDSQHGILPVSTDTITWIRQFEELNYRTRGKWDYWLIPAEEGDAIYTGYCEALKNQVQLRLTRAQIEDLGSLIPEPCKTNVDWSKSETYGIRVFERGQRIFPVGLKAFRVSFCQYAVNFPPLIAKYIYEKYTEPWKSEENIVVWDPSSGWGGRLLGAMAVRDDRHLTYLGNDPNTDHNTTPGRTKYHEISDFYRNNIQKGGMWSILGMTDEHTEFRFWQQGSEEMQFEPEFQQYKGKVSLVFTSPPYFAKEAYSEDPEQSYKKFSQYEQWRDGFLKETLKTATEWLRPGGYLAWNIADATFGGERLPLEEDSRQYLESLGMEFVETVKMALAQTPGGNRIDATTGLPKFKNFCKVDGMWLKFEPIFIFHKPL